MQLLGSVAHGLEKTSKRMAGDFGITGPQRLALRVVGLFPGVSAGELAAILRVHPSTLTGVLQRWQRRVGCVVSTILAIADEQSFA
jgi:DNA-binding MarR family transcriptional regulator